MDIFNFAFGLDQDSGRSLAVTCENGINRLYKEYLGLPEARIETRAPENAFFFATVGNGEIAFAEDGPLFLVIYGDVLGFTAQSALAVAATSGMEKMVDEMAASDGCFGALVFDSRDGTARLFGDSIGQRCLRYSSAGGTTYVSSHDVGLAMMGACGDPDPASLASVRKNGWVVGGGSLLLDVEVCRPSELLVLSGKETAKHKLSDAVSQKPIVDLALEWLDHSLQKRGPVLAELSAGFDSRASLAATLAICDAKDITAFSEGPADSLDVLVAAEIAKRAGIEFHHRKTSPPSPEALVTEWSRSSVATNGTIDVSVLASHQPNSGALPLSVCGDGGEIYRGYYYPYAPFNIGKARWNADAALAKVCTGPRIKETVEHLRGLSKDEAETLERFYAAERFGIWNQKLMRGMPARNRKSPFYSRKAARANFKDGNTLHFDLIAKYLPGTLDIPVNGEASARRYGPGLLNAMTVEFRTFSGKVGRRIQSKMGLKSADLEDARNESLAGFHSMIVEHPEWVGDMPFSKTVGRSMWQELGAIRFLAICAALGAFANSTDPALSR